MSFLKIAGGGIAKGSYGGISRGEVVKDCCCCWDKFRNSPPGFLDVFIVDIACPGGEQSCAATSNLFHNPTGDPSPFNLPSCVSYSRNSGGGLPSGCVVRLWCGISETTDSPKLGRYGNWGLIVTTFDPAFDDCLGVIPITVFSCDPFYAFGANDFISVEVIE